MANNILTDPPFCCFALCLNQISHVTKLISSLEIIIAMLPDPNIFLWTAESVAHAVAVKPNGIRTLSAYGLSTFLIKGNPVFSNGPKSLPKNTTDGPILCNWAFNNFISADEPLTKASRSLETSVLVNNHFAENIVIIRITKNIWWKFQSNFSTIFYSRF